MTTDKMPCHITDGPPSNDPADDGWTIADATRELRDALNDIASTNIAVYYNERDPTPWCHVCDAMEQADCDCLPIADNE